MVSWYVRVLQGGKFTELSLIFMFLGDCSTDIQLVCADRYLDPSPIKRALSSDLKIPETDTPPIGSGETHVHPSSNMPVCNSPEACLNDSFRRTRSACGAGAVVLITGASSGIGEDIAVQYAEKGCFVVSCCC